MSEGEIPTTEEELYAWFQWYDETHPKSKRDLNPKYGNNIMPTNPHKGVHMDDIFEDVLEHGR